MRAQLLLLGFLPACNLVGVDSGLARLACTQATSWVTSNDFQSTASQNSIGLGLGSDSSGYFYAAGKGDESASLGAWMLRRSGDGGSAWTLLDNYHLDPTASAVAWDVQVSRAGSTFVVGQGLNAASESHWIVRKGAGTSFATVDDYQLVSGQYAQAQAVAEGPSGEIVVVGSAADGTAVRHWIVRRSTDAGTTWSTVDDESQPAQGDFYAQDIKRDSSGKLFVAGVFADISGVETWAVLKSVDGGAAWTNVGVYSLQATSPSVPQALGDDPSGNLYVVGYAADGSGNHFVVRKTTDGGTSWSNVDSYQETAGQDAYATSFTRDVFGTLYAGGYFTDAGGKNHALVRKSVDGGATWTVSDTFQLASGQSTQVTSLRAQGAGNVIATGSATDTSGKTHWFTRKLGCL